MHGLMGWASGGSEWEGEKKEKEKERHRDGIDEAAMVRLLDAYSERLVRVLEQRIESRVDEVVGRKSTAAEKDTTEVAEASDVDEDDVEAEADTAVVDDADDDDTRAQQPQPQ